MYCTFITNKSNLYIYSGFKKSNKVSISCVFRFCSMRHKNMVQMKFIYCK